jgi:hypothetical protein
MHLLTRVFVFAVLALGVVSLGSGKVDSGHQPEPEGGSIDHLPEQVQRDILAWRARLQGAKVLKVATETDETWVSVHELGPDGSPMLKVRERFSIHSWMTPDSVWAVIFGYKGDVPDTEKPIFQLYWNGKERRAWERIWVEAVGAYRVRSYDCGDPYGPESPGFQSRGCIFSTTLRSWLAGGDQLADRSVTAQSVALLRHPNLAMVPPNPKEAGIWLDVFWKSVPRDQFPEPERLYRRHDFMLVARNQKGEPEVREWRTLVLTDPKEGGKKPTEITGMERFKYDFFNEAPPELGATVRAFVADVEAGVAAQPAEEGTPPATASPTPP